MTSIHEKQTTANQATLSSSIGGLVKPIKSLWAQYFIGWENITAEHGADWIMTLQWRGYKIPSERNKKMCQMRFHFLVHVFQCPCPKSEHGPLPSCGEMTLRACIQAASVVPITLLFFSMTCFVNCLCLGVFCLSDFSTGSWVLGVQWKGLCISYNPKKIPGQQFLKTTF